MDDKIVSLAEFSKRIKLEKEIKTENPSLKSILDYRTEKLLDLLDYQHKRIKALEINQRALIRALRQSNDSL